MPDMDLSDVFSDSMLADIFDVTRATETIVNGVSRTTKTQCLDCSGIVTAGDGSELVQTADASRTSNLITIHTMDRLGNGTSIRKADEIHFPAASTGESGADYVVLDVEPYSRYGAGFVTLMCQQRSLFRQGNAT